MIDGQLLFLGNTWHSIIAHYPLFPFRSHFKDLVTLYNLKKIQGTCSEILLITGKYSFHPSEPNFCNYEETEELINQLFTVYF